MLANTTLLPPKPLLGSRISHPGYNNQQEMLPRRCSSGPKRKTITVSAATATESGDGSVRTMKPSSPLFSFSLSSTGRGTSTFYQLLRVKETASQTEIKAAYRNLAKQYHPDAASSSSNPNARDFIEIHNAYATLSDPVARARYDLSIGASTASARPYGYTAGFYRPTRRWETDQCW
ncbi:chaperone protein dnaJ 11, chloroplastic-like [Corylus avellana]|uniref:chaperone protein dnaJ 11, chloroplastic-like n=1 Tax=Corylus avellana TaxID=13451 RepID=UPI001E20E50F|nr:chaperone protein dnaJ 11, chloroplastic-like [Corylus avellana]